MRLTEKSQGGTHAVLRRDFDLGLTPLGLSRGCLDSRAEECIHETLIQYRMRLIEPRFPHESCRAIISVTMNDAEVNIHVLDAAYKPFPAFEAWSSQTVSILSGGNVTIPPDCAVNFRIREPVYEERACIFGETHTHDNRVGVVTCALGFFRHYWGDPASAQAVGALFSFFAAAILVGVTWEYVRINQKSLSLQKEQWEQQNRVVVRFGIKRFRARLSFGSPISERRIS